MCCIKRLISLLFFAALLSGLATSAQTTSATAANGDEDLRQMVRELSLRVSALEDELHKERAAATFAAGTSTIAVASPAAPVVDLRNSVEGVSSSGMLAPSSSATVAPMPMAATTSSAVVSTQAAGAANTP